MSGHRKHPPYEQLTSRWGGMKLRQEMGTRIKEWLSAFPESEHAFLLELLEHFYYYSEKRIKEKVKELFALFQKECGRKVDEATYTKILKEQGVAYSDLVFSAFWLENDLADYAEGNMRGLLSEGVIPSIIAVVDDFSGTGKTFIKTIEQYRKMAPQVENSEIYFLVLHITETANQKIQAYSHDIGINIKIISVDDSQATFKAGYLYEEIAAQKNRKGYSDIYSRLALSKDYTFGFEEVEALVAFHYNTPNNTLGLFWQDLAGFCALFPRHKKKKTTLGEMQKAAKTRKERKSVVAVYGIENSQMATLMVYMLAYGKSFSMERALTDLGLTSEQLNSLLKEMIDSGYILYQDGKYSATSELKSHLFVSRLDRVKKAYSEPCQEDNPQFSFHEEYIPIHFE